jgi:hypothetical protein
MKKNLIVLILLLNLFGCGDAFIPITLSIENNTTDSITVMLISKNYIFTSSPNSKQVFYKTEARIANNFDCDPRLSLDSIEVNTISGKVLLKNMKNKNNWNCSGGKNNGWNMTFVITENDLE